MRCRHEGQFAHHPRPGLERAPGVCGARREGAARAERRGIAPRVRRRADAPAAQDPEAGVSQRVPEGVLHREREGPQPVRRRGGRRRRRLARGRGRKERQGWGQAPRNRGSDTRRDGQGRQGEQGSRPESRRRRRDHGGVVLLLNAFPNITKVRELKRRLFVTAMLLTVYRIGVYIPTPGIDTQAITALFASQSGTLFGLIDMFSGGAVSRFSIFTLGIMPYISASIILQLLTVVIPQLEKLSKEGELGRRKITQYTRYGTIVLSIIQGFGIAVGIENVAGIGQAGSVVYQPGWSFRLMTVLTLTSGTAFLMWLGEQITERGIGNGISLIIFAGIVARFPSGLVQTFTLIRTGEMGLFVGLLILVVMVAVVATIIYFERAHRRIPVQ